ncbi:MAG: M48 family metallopeptidase [Bacteroidia bacterium]
MIRKSFINNILITLVLTLFTSCTQLSNLIPLSFEDKLSEVVESSIMSDENSIIKNDSVENAIALITTRLLNSINNSNYNYQFTLIDNTDVNAFTIPGAKIFICKGLITFADTPEEVAAVLAHEIGHAEKRHVVNKIAKEFGLGIIFMLITGGDPGIVTEIIRLVASTGFDREQEKEADEFALQLLEKSGIHPKHMESFFKKINELNDVNMPEIFMTHPDSDKRAEKAASYKVSENFKEQSFNMDWESIKASI